MKTIGILLGLLLGVIVAVLIYIPFIQKKCPFCHKKIPKHATRCTHCFIKLPEKSNSK